MKSQLRDELLKELERSDYMIDVMYSLMTDEQKYRLASVMLRLGPNDEKLTRTSERRALIEQARSEGEA